jgi:hypothetical protein
VLEEIDVDRLPWDAELLATVPLCETGHLAGSREASAMAVRNISNRDAFHGSLPRLNACG